MNTQSDQIDLNEVVRVPPPDAIGFGHEGEYEKRLGDLNKFDFDRYVRALRIEGRQDLREAEALQAELDARHKAEGAMSPTDDPCMNSFAAWAKRRNLRLCYCDEEESCIKAGNGVFLILRNEDGFDGDSAQPATLNLIVELRMPVKDARKNLADPARMEAQFLRFVTLLGRGLAQNMHPKTVAAVTGDAMDVADA